MTCSAGSSSRILSLVLFGILLFCPAWADSQATTVRVWKVTGGDSFVADDGERIRTLGVVSPQVATQYVNVLAQAKEAFAFNRKLLENQTVRLEFDAKRIRDEEGRLLAYVFLEDGTFVNAEILKRGHGQFVHDAAHLLKEDLFNQLESEARQAKRGLWADTSRQHLIPRSRKKVRPPPKVWWKDD